MAEEKIIYFTRNKDIGTEVTYKICISYHKTT